MRIWITRGIHPTTPGEPISAHDTHAGAMAAACELAALILADTPLGDPPASVTPDNFDAVVERLEDYHGAAKATVWIDALEVNHRP